MDIILLIIAALFLVVGFIGTFVPVIPGPVLAWAGLLVASFSEYCEISLIILIVTAVFTVVISIMDNVFPTMLTKKSGGSKAGTWGSVIGLFIGLFLGPLGIIIGPFAGAFLGELIHDRSDLSRCLKSALGAFKGFILGTGIKMILVAVFIWIFVYKLIN